MATKGTVDQDARFVFVGMMKSTSAGVSGESAAVVTVENVMRSPQTLADSAGTDVMVLLQPGEKLGKGDRATFYSNPIRWGDLVTVQSAGHIPAALPTAGASKRRAAAATPPRVKSMAEQQLQEQVANADVVVSGKVSAVQLPGEPAVPLGMRRAGAGAAAPVPRRISEHDPMWREAVIEVKDTHKGQAGNQVVVRFPKSNDVRWKSTPKFQTGQEGVFLLHHDEIQTPAAAVARAGKKRALGAAAPPSPGSVMALTATGFQPLDREEAIKNMIRGVNV